MLFRSIANLELFDYADIPDDKFVMTTWHANEPLADAFWFSKHNAFHDTVEIANTLLVHISASNKERDMLLSYAQA